MVPVIGHFWSQRSASLDRVDHMRTHSKTSLIGMSLLLALLTATASAQMLRQPGSAPKTVPDAITALKEAPDFKKAGARADLVDAINAVIATQGNQVLDPIVKTVQDRLSSEEPIYVVNCILTLGEVKAKDSTNLLIGVLSDTNLEYAYQAAVALGDIWEKTPATTPQVKTVNSALLALLYADLPSTVVFGPGAALVKINQINVPDPTRLSADQLRGQIDRWVNSAPAALPSIDQLPYQALVRLLSVSSDATKRSAALQALRQQRPLGAIDPILARLGSGSAGASAADMGQLLGELSGVPYPPAGLAAGATAHDTADAWRKAWLEALRTKTDARSVQYSWHALEDMLRFYAVNPDEATAQKISDLYDAMLWQVAGPASMPAGTSAFAKRLLAEPLKVKKKMADAVDTLETSTDDYTKGVAISTISVLLNEQSGPTVAIQFLPRLVAAARKEPSQVSAAALGDILWRVAAVPLNLNGPTLADRQKQVDKWVGDVHKTKPDLKV